jgi:HK97 family phage prohead protease
MEIREVSAERREVEGVCVPYGETSRVVPNPHGERIMPGAFRRSIAHRAGRILMYREHGHLSGEDPIGRAIRFDDSATELRAVFTVRDNEAGTRALADMREGYLPALSVGFAPLSIRKADDGATEVIEARLLEVSAVAMAAYESAEIMAVRHALDVEDILTKLGPMPVVNLSPIPRLWV